MKTSIVFSRNSEIEREMAKLKTEHDFSHVYFCQYDSMLFAFMNYHYTALLK